VRLNTVIQCIVFLLLAIPAVLGGESRAQTTTSSLVPEVNILRGNFVQVRYMKGFKNPLKSEGRFLVSKANGVVWQGIKPFPSKILIRNSGVIVNLDQAKTTAKKKTAKPNAAMSKIMLAMLSGDQAEISKHFTVQRSESKGIWTLQLQPKGGMARVFSRIEMTGERYIHQVIMEEKSGDKTEMNFTAVSEVPDSLSADELAYFK